MVHYCCAIGCKEKASKDCSVSFHSFPKDEKRRKVWLARLKRENFTVRDSTKICSKHFASACFDREKFGGSWLKKTAVPTLFDFHLQPKTNGKKRIIQDAIVPLPDPGPSVAKCKNRWASIRDTFPETTEPRKKHKSSEVTYTQSIYEADNGKLLGNPEAEKRPSNSIKLENSTWPADFADFPDQSSSDQGPSMNFPEIKVEVNNFGGEERTDGNNSIIENSNCGFGYIVPNSLYEVVTKTEPSLSKKRTCAESDEGTASAKSNKKGELSSSESESVAVAQPEYKPAEHPIETFFKSMAATVMTFPPHLMAIAKLNVCKLITELELRALTEKNPFVVSQDGVNELLSENIIDICSENSISVENGTRNEEG
ncbi:uncharacterized protein LOC129974966 isoform X3 [Argiope bruennichi]|uniref:uncharacterized protein LOC129974966 isoform X3 n=1 Tax=Argiope bruennichi TaxID=94029 RepID=UPI002494026B|nr:uncharacterized protein LOC129974966 isoform X3 [Argiope bruennichi]